MFDFDTVIDLMKKYGYSSTSVHPYIYQNGDSLGLCYTYIDEEFGLLERIKIFDNLESFELFLKQLDFIKTNGKNYNVRMVLDNYESMNPKVVFLRNEKIMVEGEMFDISNYDLMTSQRSQLDAVSQIVYKAGDLLLVYDEVKGRQLQYLRNIVSLKNTLRTKYFDLQKEIDLYNNYKVERTLNLIPDVHDIGINDTMEIAIKDRYNMYIAQRPSYEEAVDFLKEVWDLNKNLELNTQYYEALKDENDTRNEMKIVDSKLELMKKLNEDYKPLFGIDLVSRFRKINKKWNSVNNSISSEIIQESIERIERKYSVYDNLNILSTSDYLREAMQNTNYGDLVIKYSKDNKKDVVATNRLPLNEVAADLSLQYRDRLDVTEQAIMVLYNNHKYRKLCNAILEIDGFETLPVKKVISKISGIKGFSKIKTECYDIVKKRIDEPINTSIKNSLFNGYDFTSFETFITSLIRELVKLRNVNNKMVINGSINMYLQIKKVEDVSSKKFILVTNDLNELLNNTKETNDMIGIVLLKKDTPVLYSPYYLDVGDIYSKGASLQMYIREMINFELLVETSDITINIDPVKTNVVRYYSEPEVVDNISVVSDIMMSYKTTFCKFAFTSNLAVPEVIQNILTNNVVANNVVEVPVVPNNNIDNNVNVVEPVTNITPEVDESVVISSPIDNKIDESIQKQADVVQNDGESKPIISEEKAQASDLVNSEVKDSNDKVTESNKTPVSTIGQPVKQNVQVVQKIGVGQTKTVNSLNGPTKPVEQKIIVKNPNALNKNDNKQVVTQPKQVVNPEMKGATQPVAQNNKVVVNSLSGQKPAGKVVVNSIGAPVKNNKPVGQIKVGNPQNKVVNTDNNGGQK